jgi:hypothetical protein
MKDFLKENWGIIFFVSFIIGMLFGLTKCNGFRSTAKKYTSNTTGLNRTVILYSANGEVIKTWNITSTIESNCDGVWFMNEQEKFIAISGTYIIEEK